MADAYEMLERVILDPEDSPLELTGGRVPDSEGHGVGVTEAGYPRPDVQQTWAGSRNTEGEVKFGDPRYQNRKINLKLWVWEARGVGPAVNLVTNPSLELDAAGWATSGGALTAGGTLTRVQHGFAGEWCGELVASASNRGAGIPVALAAGETYTLRFAARKVSGSVSSLSVARGGTTLGTVTLTDSWQMFEITVPGAAGSQFMSWRTNAAGTFQLDAVLLTTGTPLYFDGDTPGCRWTGTPHNSSSERLGSGDNLKRAIRVIHGIESKLEKMAREGGTVRRVLGDGTPVTFDVVDASYPANWERSFSQGKQTFEIELTCRPFGRLAPVTVSPVTSTGSLLTIDTGLVPGNAPALGRLKLTSAARREFVNVGVGPQAGVLTADTRKILSGSKVSSPGGTVNGTQVVRGVLQPIWAPYVSTSTAAGEYESHRGLYRVFARVRAVKDCQVRLEWAQADLSRWVKNKPVTVTAGGWVWVDLGPVSLTTPVSQPWGDGKGWRWEGRLCAIADAPAGGDYLYVDAWNVHPASDGYAEVRPLTSLQTTPEVIYGAGVNKAATGSLNGKAALVGGIWATQSGSGPDWSASPGSEWMERKAAYPGVVTGQERTTLLGTGTAAGIQGKCDLFSRMQFYPPGFTGIFAGVVARYVSATSYVAIGQYDRQAWVGDGFDGTNFVALVFNSGTLVASDSMLVAKDRFGQVGFLTWNIDTAGNLQATLDIDGEQTGSLALSHASLATGGTLATGRYGLRHTVDGVGGGSSAWANVEFRAYTTLSEPDAVIYPARNLLVNSDTALREDPSGNSLGLVGQYQGDRLTLPPGKTSKVAVLHTAVAGHREDSIPAITGDLTFIPRVVDLPEPS